MITFITQQVQKFVNSFHHQTKRFVTKSLHDQNVVIMMKHLSCWIMIVSFKERLSCQPQMFFFQRFFILFFSYFNLISSGDTRFCPIGAIKWSNISRRKLTWFRPCSNSCFLNSMPHKMSSCFILQQFKYSEVRLKMYLHKLLKCII